MGVSSVGIGSGLEVEKIVSQMVELEKSPLKNLQAKATSIQTQISAYGEIKSLTSTLNDIVSKMSRDSGWNSVNITSSNTAVSGAMTGIAATGSFNISVSKLAQAQTSMIGGAGGISLPKDQSMGTGGNLKLEIGGKSFDVEIGAGDNLTKIAAKVNGSGAGIQATVLANADGTERLMLRSKETGTPHAFTATVTTTPLTKNPTETDADFAARQQEVADSTLAKLTVSQAQAAQNAQAKLNGVDVESASNTFTDAIPGMSFSVSAVTTTATGAGDVLLTVKSDTESIKKNIQDFVEAYNKLNDLLSKSTKNVRDLNGKVDTKATEDGTGVLQGDSATVSLQNALRTLTMGASGSTGSLRRLSDIGIQMQQGGKLTIDDTKLTKGLAKGEDLKALFANKADSQGGGGGIAVNFKSFTDKLLAYEGTFDNKTSSMDKTLKRNQQEQDKVNTRANNLQIRLYKQYSALDTQMASISGLNSYVSQMVSSMNKSKD
jgi:flagellar hook-associated protein 2